MSRKNGNNAKATCLGLDIKIKINKFEIGFSDQRDNFHFSIIRMPEKSSNIS